VITLTDELKFQNLSGATIRVRQLEQDLYKVRNTLHSVENTEVEVGYINGLALDDKLLPRAQKLYDAQVAILKKQEAALSSKLEAIEGILGE